ncbi:putative spermidine/putrescine transport system substrate-binding protein/spermidine/putrescine transport system substrate-binding protein [Mycobacterium sp. BK558]|nr:extracellular solute-binding protein [Mycolicibacterium rufum]RZT19104.1 putative spermidine/putrescine transport system substrate-binding protein/spermidine/putrescine transport system substrate-binding protein [Mycobacterium sp. BK558]
MKRKVLTSHQGARKALVILIALVTASLGLAACGGSQSTDANTLNVLTWQGYHEQPWLDEFTKETGIKVNAVNVGSPDEMFAKIKANPKQFDLALVTAGWFDNYAKAGLLEPIDAGKVTNTPNPGFDWKSVASSGGKQYGVLYNWGDQPLAWVPGSIPNTPEMAKYLDAQGRPNDWNIYWDPAFAGKVSIFDDPTSVLPMIPLALGIEDPFNLTPEQFTQVQQKLDALRPQVKRLTSGYNDQVTQFASGEATIGYLNIISEVGMLAKDGKKLEVNHEVKQGVPAWSDNYAITKAGADKADSVYKFINYTTAVPWQARFIAASQNSGTLSLEQAQSEEAVMAGLTKDALAQTLIPATASGDAFFSKMRFYQPVEDLNKRVDLWNQFKLGISS